MVRLVKFAKFFLKMVLKRKSPVVFISAFQIFFLVLAGSFLSADFMFVLSLLVLLESNLFWEFFSEFSKIQISRTYFSFLAFQDFLLLLEHHCIDYNTSSCSIAFAAVQWSDF